MVTAIKIDFGSRQFALSETAEAIVSMKAPAQVPTNYAVARNTLNFAINEVLSDTLLRPFSLLVPTLPNSFIDCQTARLATMCGWIAMVMASKMRARSV